MSDVKRPLRGTQMLQLCESKWMIEEYGQRRPGLEGPAVYLLSEFYISHRSTATQPHLQGDTIHLQKIALSAHFLLPDKTDALMNPIVSTYAFFFSPRLCQVSVMYQCPL